MSFFKRRRKQDDEVKILVQYVDDDDARFNCVGVHKGKQFMAFVTGAAPWDFEADEPVWLMPDDPDWMEKKRWYGVLHLFELNGEHAQTVAVLGGSEAEGRAESGQRAFDALNDIIVSMEAPEFRDISIKPFRYEQDGYLFGLVMDEDGENATLWPNDIMFHSPWDGEFST